MPKFPETHGETHCTMTFAIMPGLLPGRPVAGLAGRWCSPGMGGAEPAVRVS